MTTPEPAWVAEAVDPFARKAHGPRSARRPSGHLGMRLLSHGVSLLLAVGCFVAYQHLKLEGRPGAALACLALAAALAFMPIRHLVRAVVGLEGKALHLVHGLGSLVLLALPLSGLVSGTPVVSHAWLGPFAIMGAAQALMHSEHPRNAAQATALRSFAASLPEVARIADSKDLASPANASRAVAVLSDVIGRAQALGQTEVAADPGFQGALQRVSTLEANLGLDAVALALRKLAANPAAAGAVPGLERRLAAARTAVAGGASR